MASPFSAPVSSMVLIKACGLVREQVQAVVIGGGIVGCSILYHLTLLGWRDIMLLEKHELTSGSTWHAAANIHRFDTAPNLIRLRDESIKVYQKLGDEAVNPLSMQQTGGLVLAASDERLQELYLRAARARVLGMPQVVLTPEQALDHHPLLDIDGVKGALYDPLAGHVDPYDVTHALARGAERRGGRIHRRLAVKAMSQNGDGTWLLITERGEVIADIVINAAGLWAGEVAAMIGLELPLAAVEHQYVVTEAMADVTRLDFPLPYLIEPDAAFDLRRDGAGLILGAFENEMRLWAEDGVPDGFGQDLLPDDLTRLEPHLALARRRVPCLAEARLKAPVNGPVTMSPDGRPLVGPVPGLINYYVAVGFIDGIALAGGIGRVLAEWIVEGAPPLDLFPVDVARFGSYARKAYATAKVKESYQRYYAISFPHEERPAGRPLRSTPIHDRLHAKGARFGFHAGWETPKWFALADEERDEAASFTRGAWFPAVCREVRALREGAGLIDLTPMLAKHVIEGPAVETGLDYLLASALPGEVGRIAQAVMLDRLGRFIGRFTVTKVTDSCFYLIGDSVAERYHRRWIEQCLPRDGIVYGSVSLDYAVLGLAGPRAGELLARLTSDDVSLTALPLSRAVEVEIAGAPTQVLHLSSIGESVYEIHLPMAYQATVYARLVESGLDLGLIDVGIMAFNSARLEAGHDLFGVQTVLGATPAEAGIAPLIANDKGDFVGSKAMRQAKERPAAKQHVMLRIDADDGDAIGAEPVYWGETLVGAVLCGGYGPTVQESLAFALVDLKCAEPGARLAVDLFGDRREAIVLDGPPLGLGRA